MVAVIVNHQGFAAIRQRDFAIVLEAAPHAFKGQQAFLNRFHRCAHFQRHRNGGQRVEHIVAAGHIEHHFKRRLIIVFHLHGKAHLCAFCTHIGGVNIGIIVQPVSGKRLADFRQHRAHMLAVYTQKRFAVKRHAVDEIDKSLVQLIHAVVVSVHMVGVDIGHHRHHRREMQKRSIRFVGLGHNIFAAPQAGVGAGGGEFAADYKSGIHAGRCQNRGGEAGGGGFAVGAGYGDAVAETHQFGQHQRARNHRNFARLRRHHFGVVFFHGGGSHHHIGIGHMLGGVAGIHFYAQIAQMACYRALRLIRAGHLEAQIVQHFGNAAHARAADADEMNVVNPVFHHNCVSLLPFQTAFLAPLHIKALF